MISPEYHLEFGFFSIAGFSGYFLAINSQFYSHAHQVLHNTILRKPGTCRSMQQSKGMRSDLIERFNYYAAFIHIVFKDLRLLSIGRSGENLLMLQYPSTSSGTANAPVSQLRFLFSGSVNCRSLHPGLGIVYCLNFVRRPHKLNFTKTYDMKRRSTGYYCALVLPLHHSITIKTHV